MYKYKIKRKKMPEFIDVELKSNSSSGSEWFFSHNNVIYPLSLMFETMRWLLFGWLLLWWCGLLLTFSLGKTSLGETGCLDNLYFLLTGCLDIQFFTPLFLTQSVRLPLVTYPSPSSICVTYRTPCHASGHQVLPTQPLVREAGSFLRLTIIEGACLYSHT